MFDNWKNKIYNDLTKKQTMKQNFWDIIGRSYIPSLMLVVYYLIPEGKQIMEQTISYELWYVLVIILMFSFVLTPLFNFIEQYRSRNKYVR